MKNVIVLGANGDTAKEIIARLLPRGDVVLSLFLRGARRLRHVRGDRVRLVEGDATNGADLIAAIKGQDIVVSTMGGMDLDVKTAHVVRAMEEAGASRIIAISAGGIYDELPEPFDAWDKSMVGETRPVNRRMADLIERSSLRHTILRPVWLTSEPTEEFELTQKGEPFKGTETSRASIGRFVADL